MPTSREGCVCDGMYEGKVEKGGVGGKIVHARVQNL